MQKNLCHFVQKIDKKKNKKTIGVVKRYVLTPKRKNYEIFENICISITLIQQEEFLINSKDLILSNSS